MNWTEIKDQRDADGKLTKLALAVDALENNGCDCGTDEPGTCLACCCEAALKSLWEQQVEAHRSACNQRTDREMTKQELARAPAHSSPSTSPPTQPETAPPSHATAPRARRQPGHC